MSKLHDMLVEKATGYRDVAAVFRIAPRTLDEMEADAMRLAAGVAGDKGELRRQVRRAEGHSEILLSEGVSAKVYHASGAIAVKAGLAPMENLIGTDVDRDRLKETTIGAAKRLGLDRFIGDGEQLLYERLWQIKANGMSAEGRIGREVVCRAVGAFRRYVDEMPVWGRASAFVEVAGDDRIGAAGVDWRPVMPDPIDRVKVLDPERAAQALLGDLNGRLPGGGFDAEDFDVGMFALGYLSKPKGREQSVLAPVWVAALERRGWGSMNHMIVVGAGEVGYESFCRIAASPPREGVKPKAGGTPGRAGTGWDPTVKPGAAAN